MNKSIERVKTVIIGAGISGVSAALNFLYKNYEDFVIFEALDRIGGRMFTYGLGKINQVPY